MLFYCRKRAQNNISYVTVMPCSPPADFLFFTVCCVSIYTCRLLAPRQRLLPLCLCTQPVRVMDLKKKKLLGKNQCESRHKSAADTQKNINRMSRNVQQKKSHSWRARWRKRLSTKSEPGFVLLTHTLEIIFMHTAALCENSVIWTDDFSLCLHLTITYRLQLMCVFTGSGENETHQHVNDEVNEPLWVQILFFFL